MLKICKNRLSVENRVPEPSFSSGG